jgi:hypothetical protein
MTEGKVKKGAAKFYFELTDFEDLDTVRKYDAFVKRWNSALENPDKNDGFVILTEVVKSWELAGDPRVPESFENLHPRQLSRIIAEVNRQLKDFFQYDE